MKKIRLLALLLALLMIPFGMLFACNDDDDVEEPEEEGGDDEEESGGQTQTGSGDKTVEDGTRVGYLAFFGFDNADVGNLGVIKAPDNISDPNYVAYSDLKPIQPYATNFTGTLVNGGAYTVTSNKHLSIQRENATKETAPTLDFVMKDVVTALEKDHIIEFKLMLEKGLFSSPVTISGVKGGVLQTLIVIEEYVDDNFNTHVFVKDCEGNVIYGEKSTDELGWVDVAIVVNDGSRKYDVFIDAVKQTQGVEYSNTEYKDWHTTHVEAYRFAIGATNKSDVYVRLDDLSIRNGREADLSEVKGQDYSDVFTDTVFAKKSFLLASIDALKAYLAPRVEEFSLKSDIFGEGSLLSEVYTIAKVNTETGVIVDAVEDYGVLLGKYDANAVFIGENATLTIATYGEKKVVYTAGGASVEGTYSVDNGVITFDFGEGVAPEGVVAATFADNKLTVYADAECATEGVVYAMQAPVGADIALGENEVFAVKMNPAKVADENNQFALEWDPIWYANNKDYIGDITLKLFVTEDMYAKKVEFQLCLGINTYSFAPLAVDGDGEPTPYAYVPGMNEFTVKLTEIDGEAVESFTIKFTEKLPAPEEEGEGGEGGEPAPQNTEDTYGLEDFEAYFVEFEMLVGGIKVEVEGPMEGEEDCDHDDDEAFEPVSEPVAGNGCAHGGFYVLKCADCGATKFDDSKKDLVGYVSSHTYKDEYVTVNPTCIEGGRVYRECKVCGIQETIETKEATGHLYEVTTTIGNIVTKICKICGASETVKVYNQMMSFEEKLRELGYTSAENNSWCVGETEYYFQKAEKLNGWISTKNVDSKDEPGGYLFLSEITGAGKMLKIYGEDKSKYKETFIDIEPAGYNVSFIKEQSFTMEFDYMLGEPGTDGKYPRLLLWPAWRNDKLYGYDKNKFFGMLDLTEDGCIKLGTVENGQHNAIVHSENFVKCEKDTLYNIALYHDLENNVVKLYVNGKYIEEAQLLANVEEALKFSPTHYRLNIFGFHEGSENYINNYIHYVGEPICLVDEEIKISDVSGEITLEDELFNPMLKEFDVAEDGHDVKVNVPAAHYLKDYVIEFSLSGVKKDGAVLKVTKNARGFDRSVGLVEVKGGKVYVKGVLVSESVDIKLSLVFDDKINALYVYVNGEKIMGTSYFDGDFADSAAYIRSFTFLRDCGSYKVSGLKMSTELESK